MNIFEAKKIINQNIISAKSILKPYLFPSRINIEIEENTKYIFVFLCGFYQNLGDMALTYAHKSILVRYFGDDYKLLLIGSSNTYGAVKEIKRKIKKEDIITVLGGGNMDDIYYSLENARRHIIHSFPNNRIVLFPQTMAFSNTEYGLYRLKKTANTYNKHRDLHIFAREKKSYYLMKNTFINAKKVGLVPDMVLYLRPDIDVIKRSGVLCVFRDDYENGDISSKKNLVFDYLESNYSVEYSDTTNVTKEECREENIEETLFKFWKLLASKELVVTDRLHCMIFCVITKTPCIAFDNSNRKISGIYDKWLTDIDYITFLREFEYLKFQNECRKLININALSTISFEDEFLPLIKSIRGQVEDEGY